MDDRKPPRKQHSHRRKHHDARRLLRSDHKAISALIGQAEASRSATEKKALVEQACVALTVLARLEEEILYPALAPSLANATPIAHAQWRRAHIESLIAAVRGVEPDDDADYDLNIRRLLERVRDQGNEQHALLPRKDRKLDLTLLGDQLAARRRELLAGVQDFGGWD